LDKYQISSNLSEYCTFSCFGRKNMNMYFTKLTFLYLFPSYVESIQVIVKFNQLSTDFISYFSGNFWRKYSSSWHDRLSTIAHITQSKMYYKIVWTNSCFLQCILVPLSHRIWYFCPCIVLIVVILQYTAENRNLSTQF